MNTEGFNISLILPEIVILVAAIIPLIIDMVHKSKKQVICYWFSLVALVLAAIITILTQLGAEEVTFSGAYTADAFGSVLKLTIFFCVIGVFIYSHKYILDRSLEHGEYYMLALTGVLGMMIMVSGHNLLMLYLGIELLAMSLYSLVVYCRRSGQKSVESGVKYYVLGAVASAILLFGMAMIYGATGSINLAEIKQAVMLGQFEQGRLLLGIALAMVAFAFKFGAVPFHMWLPDVYEGSPTAVSVYIASAPKVAALGFGVRLLAETFDVVQPDWKIVALVLALLSALAGNLLMLKQTNLKRLLGYSAVAHAGYVFLGFAVGKSFDYDGYTASLFYTVTYAFMVVGVFGLLLLVTHHGHEAEKVEDFKGLFKASPWVAFLLLIMMLSMAGVPGTVGFYAKLIVLQAAVDASMTWLAAVFVVLTVIGAYAYLKVLKYCFFDQATDPIKLDERSDFRILIGVNGLLVLGFGVFPDSLIGLFESIL